MVHHSQRFIEVKIAPFQVSVIIPVYNAAVFVTQAVESALAQPETAEVLVIEDGSPDNGLEICQALANKYDKVRLLQHPNGENRGAGASRNLGMKSAICDYIAFLDADDYYLPGRFTKAKDVITADPTCEGVYDAIGMHIEDKLSWDRWLTSGKSPDHIKTIREPVEPDRLGIELISGKVGYFHLNGFVFKKSLLQKTGMMDEKLLIHQDTNFIIKAALTSKLLPGSMNQPVALWRVHQANRVSAPRTKNDRKQDRMNFLQNTYSWTKKNNQKEAKNLLIKMIFFEVTRINENELQDLSKINRVGKRFGQLSNWVRTHNEMLLEPQFWKSMLLFVFSAGGRI